MFGKSSGVEDFVEEAGSYGTEVSDIFMPCDRVGGFRFKYWDVFKGDFYFSRRDNGCGVCRWSFALSNFLWRFLFMQYAMSGGSEKRCPNALSSWRWCQCSRITFKAFLAMGL